MRDIVACGLALAGASAIGVILTLGPGCNDTVSTVCDAICDCWQCDAPDYEDCVDDMEDAVHSAERKGCASAADDLLRCVEADLRCARDRDAIRPTRCGGEQDRLAACGVTVPVLGPACELGVERLRECHGASPEPDPCAGPNRCSYGCYAVVTCAELQASGSQRLSECLLRCSTSTTSPGPLPR